jgi:hypothetical protein
VAIWLIVTMIALFVAPFVSALYLARRMGRLH